MTASEHGPPAGSWRGPQRPSEHGWRRGRARRLATDPLVPAALLAAAGAATAAASATTHAPYASVLTWAVLGGLAGYALSGSV